MIPFSVSVSNQVVGRRWNDFAVTSVKSAAECPRAASNVTIGKRFVSLNGSGIVWERPTGICRERLESSVALAGEQACAQFPERFLFAVSQVVSFHEGRGK